MARSVLVIDDDMLTRRLLERALDAANLSVTTATGYREGDALAAQRPFDVILVDLGLPDGDGLELCARMRARLSTPIIIVTSRGDTEDIVQGLERGADDYITKPFDVRTVVARVNAQLRRASELAGERREQIRIGELVIDPSRRDVFIDDRPTGLTKKEFDLIELLAKRASRAVSKDALIEHLWGDDADRSEKILAVYIRHVRQKIERDPDEPRYLQTLRGFGYVLVDPAKGVPNV